VPAKLT